MRRAFTFIELTIVIFILAILSLSLALAYQRIQAKIQFDAHISRVTSLFQKARTLSLSTLMVSDTDPTQYYLLHLSEGGMLLDAYGTSGTPKNIETYTFDEGLTFMGTLDVYYYPPYGDVCIGSSCPDDSAAQTSLLFIDETSAYTATFSISEAGGYVEVEEL